MNTKSKNFNVAPGFEDLFTFKTREANIEHRAQMVSYRILSEIEKFCEEKKIKRKDLAEMVGTSASYMTQLFRGNKQINTQMLAKFEEALDVVFEFYLKRNDESYTECLSKLLTKKSIDKINYSKPEFNSLFQSITARPSDTEELVEKMLQEHEKGIGVKIVKHAA